MTETEANSVSISSRGSSHVYVSNTQFKNQSSSLTGKRLRTTRSLLITIKKDVGEFPNNINFPTKSLGHNMWYSYEQALETIMLWQ